jgi:hypothetical protein
LPKLTQLFEDHRVNVCNVCIDLTAVGENH